MSILTAITEKNEVIILSSKSQRDELEQLRENTLFFCPQCHQSVLLKIGRVKVPHFAHKVNDSCILSFSEGESAAHLMGKQQLYDFFQTQSDSVQLEPFLQNLSQRPDLLIKHNNKRYAIEFQCSTIPINLVDERSLGYENHQITPIWILHSFSQNPPMKDGIQLVKMSPFRQHFIQTDLSFGSSLMTFNPSTSSFFYYSYLLPIHGYQFIAKIRELPLSLQQFPFLQVKEPSLDEFQQYWFIFKQQRATFLRNRIFQNRNGVQDVFLRGCYYARIQPENLPLFIGVPFKENIFVKAHYVEWQACFCFYLFEAGILASSVGDEQILAFVRKNPEWFADNRSILAVKRYAAFLSFLSVSLLQTSVEEKKIVDIIYCDFLAKR